MNMLPFAWLIVALVMSGLLHAFGVQVPAAAQAEIVDRLHIKMDALRHDSDQA